MTHTALPLSLTQHSNETCYNLFILYGCLIGVKCVCMHVCVGMYVCIYLFIYLLRLGQAVKWFILFLLLLLL